MFCGAATQAAIGMGLNLFTVGILASINPVFARSGIGPLLPVVSGGKYLTAPGYRLPRAGSME
jgi:hypothetical protein